MYADYKMYLVTLNRKAVCGRVTYKPLHDVEMTGVLLKQIIAQNGDDVIDRAVEIGRVPENIE